MQQMTLQNIADQNDYVCFRIGEQDYCIDIEVVREIRGWTPATVLPHAPEHVTGVINLRGSVVAVVDLAARLAIGKTRPTPRHVVIIVAFGNQTIGLLADVVSDIMGIDETAMQPVPDVASHGAGAFITKVIALDDGRMLRKLDLTAVLPGTDQEAA